MKMMTRLTSPAPSRLLLAGAVLLALSGCASVGRYPTEDPAVAATYGRGDAALNAPADDPRSSLDTPGRDVRQDTWWTGFGDERLDRLVAQALARLMVELELDENRAYEHIRKLSMELNRSLEEICAELVGAAAMNRHEGRS